MHNPNNKECPYNATRRGENWAKDGDCPCPTEQKEEVVHASRCAADLDGCYDGSCLSIPEQKEEWEEEYITLLGTLMEISAFSAYLGSFHHGKIKDFIRTQIALAEERGRREEMERHVKTLSALSSMWNQYCSNENGHEFMFAGEEASEVLSKYGLLKAMKGKMINGMFGNSEVDYPLSVEECEKFFLSTLTQKL